MSKRFKLILFIRFLGYFLFLLGVLSFIFVFGPLVQAETKYRWDRVWHVQRTVPQLIASNEAGDNGQGQQDGAATFGSVAANEQAIIPDYTDFGIVIEKINANAKVVPNVDPGNEAEYSRALAQGVAMAKGSTLPGENGNLYLFSHSTDAPWNIVRFNAIFYLLRELEKGDRIVIFYQNKRYDYVVFDKAVTEPADVSYLLNRYDAPVLTLQTCDPPGTLLKRLIVRARLAGS
ncbi:sortase [Candidatus Daviesbacteria bacterium]|nr:sortase [Candidatus Daviesbacteria bacterium]